MFMNTIAHSKDFKKLSNLIEPTSNFVNREKEINLISESFKKSKKILSITGISGIGKTQLLRRYAIKNFNKYELIWFFNCQKNIKRQFLELAMYLNENIYRENYRFSEDINQAKEEVLLYLQSKKNWLLIFDNLKLQENTKVKEFLNFEHNGNIIISSQDSTGLPNIIELSLFSKDITALLIGNINKHLDHNEVTEIINLFGGYPLGVDRFTGFITNNPNLDIKIGKSMFTSENYQQNFELAIKSIFDNLDNKSKKTLASLALLDNNIIYPDLIKLFIKDGNVDKVLHRLHKFNLLSLSNKEKYKGYEMHDLIKNSVVKFYEKREITKEANELLVHANAIFPEGAFLYATIISKNMGLIGSLEEVTKNADMYDANVFENLSLRKNLFITYLNILDYEGCNKHLLWLNKREKKGELVLSKMSKKQKRDYAYFIMNRGVYSFFIKDNLASATKDYNKALEIALSLNDENTLMFDIYLQFAQILSCAGDIDNAIKFINYSKKYKNKAGVDADINLFYYTNAKIMFENGNFTQALNSIEKSIELNKDLAQNEFTDPNYELKVEILCKLKRYNDAYNIAKDLYSRAKNYSNKENEMSIRALIILASSEIGIGKFDEAIVHLAQAKQYFLNVDNNIKRAGGEFTGDIYKLEGDIYREQQKYKYAYDTYLKALNSYKIIYKKALKNERICEVLLQLLRMSKKLKDNDMANHYFITYDETFGIEHYKKKEMMQILLEK